MNHDKAQGLIADLPQMKEDLPFSPTILKELIVKTGSDAKASMDEVGDIIAQDQGLTARVLSMANSAFYGLQAEVTSVNRATAVLGLGEIRSIVLSLSVKGMAEKYTTPSEFDIKEYWAHQFYVGLLAKELSRWTGVSSADNMFTVGLLHDLGKLIIAMHRPDDYIAIDAMAREENIPMSQAEDRYWGLDHAVVGALLLKSWDLPSELVEPVSWHHAASLAPTHQNEATLACLADAMSHVAEDPDGPHSDQLDELCAKFKLERETMIQKAVSMKDEEAVANFVAMVSWGR